MRVTVKQILPKIAKQVGDTGICIDSPNGRAIAVQALNDVTENLLKRADSLGSLWYWCSPVSGGMFSLPTDCASVRQAWVNGVSVEQRNELWEGRLHVGIQSGAIHCDGGDLIKISDDFAIPTPLPRVNGLRVCFVAESDADAGTIVTVEIVNNYGERAKHEVILLKNAAPAYIPDLPHDILTVYKGETHGNVKLQTEYPSGLRYNHCLYDSWLPVGSFSRYKLPERLSEACRRPELLIKGKRRFIEVRDDNDFVLISDKEALRFGLMALNALDQRNLADYNTNITFAVNELSKQNQDVVAPASSGSLQFSLPIGCQRIGSHRGFN